MSERWKCPGRGFADRPPHIVFGESYGSLCRLCSVEVVREQVALGDGTIAVPAMLPVSLVRAVLDQLDETVKNWHDEIRYAQQDARAAVDEAEARVRYELGEREAW